MKNKNKPKPRVMWAHYDFGHDPIVCGNRSLIRICERSAGVKAIRVAVVPLDDVEGMVIKAAGAYWAGEKTGATVTRGDAMRMALSAIGIPCKKKASK